MGDLDPRTKRYISQAVSGAVGGAAVGGILGVTGAAGKNNTGMAMGWGALIGAGAGLLTAGLEDVIDRAA